MMIKSISTLLVLGMLSTSSLSAKNGDQYIGVQNLGISYKLDFSDTTAIQGVIGKSIAQDGLVFEASGIYKLPIERYVNGLGYLSAVVMRSDYGDNEISFGASASLGVEVDIRAVDKDLPPVFLSGKGGIAVGLLNTFDYGIGIHYKF